MTAPRRHRRSDGSEPLPFGAEAMGEPFAAFPSWFLRVECDRCGKVQMVNEVHAPWARGRSEHPSAPSDARSERNIHTRRLQHGPISLNDRPNGNGLTGPILSTFHRVILNVPTAR